MGRIIDIREENQEAISRIIASDRSVLINTIGGFTVEGVSGGSVSMVSTAKEAKDLKKAIDKAIELGWVE